MNEREHAAYWRERIASMSDAELSKWIHQIARDKMNARIVTDGLDAANALTKALQKWKLLYGPLPLEIDK